MSLEVSDQRGARWVKLLQLLDMDLTYDREKRLWWSTAIIHGHTRPTALAVIDLADLSRVSWDSALTELFEHAADSSWDGDIWIVAAGRLIQPGLDPGWGPEFQASGWICQYHGDLPGDEGWAAAPAPWADCTTCGITGTFHPEQSFLWTPNGCYDAGSNWLFTIQGVARRATPSSVRSRETFNSSAPHTAWRRSIRPNELWWIRLSNQGITVVYHR